ncbi:hypothetical protein [Asticcacaulis taihuensis]|uniref:hypothetical protein n=1 Tax=Asticcacaulis taihuensis TaxID=260084 RepID=UPI0026F2A75F|nr:hypothetical protein [Asticcacaulis taihuensis]
MTAGVWVAIASFGFSLVCTMAGCLIWFVRLEGRVNTQEKLQQAHERWVDKRHGELGDRMDEGFSNMRADLGKIFDRLEGKADKAR